MGRVTAPCRSLIREGAEEDADELVFTFACASDWVRLSNPDSSVFSFFFTLVSSVPSVVRFVLRCCLSNLSIASVTQCAFTFLRDAALLVIRCYVSYSPVI